jgi:hypothetical protein
MFKHKKKKTGVQTPEFRRPTPPPPPPTSGSNAVKPPNVGSSVQRSKQLCSYETPCGWCTKWDKKCDEKIGETSAYNPPCKNCVNYFILDMPSCKKCGRNNNYKYFMSKE